MAEAITLEEKERRFNEALIPIKSRTAVLVSHFSTSIHRAARLTRLASVKKLGARKVPDAMEGNQT